MAAGTRVRGSCSPTTRSDGRSRSPPYSSSFCSGSSRSSGRRSFRSSARTYSPRPSGSGCRTTRRSRTTRCASSRSCTALIYTALFVPLSVAGGLFTAIALNRQVRGVRFYRTAVFVPVVASTIATADHLPVAVRPDVRPGELDAREGGTRAVRVLRQPERRAVFDRRDDGVGLDRVRRDRLPGGAAGDPRRAGRGGRDRRRRHVGPLPQHHAARCSVPRRCSWSCGPRSTRSSCSTRSTS